MRGVCRPLRLRDTKQACRAGQLRHDVSELWRPSVALLMLFVYCIDRDVYCVHSTYSLCVSVCVHTI